jgi:hypothetical protein
MMMKQREEMGRNMSPDRGQARGMGMGRRMPEFSDFDQNGDGKITEEEFNDARAKRMSSMAERGYMMRNAANAPSFSDIDSNKDGAINKKEFSDHQSSYRYQGR